MKAQPDGSKALRRLVVFALIAVATAMVLALPAAANPRGVNGKIVVHSANQVTGFAEIYMVDPDGTDRQFLSIGESGQWSPDGTRISLCAFNGDDSCFLATLNVDTGSVVDLHMERYDLDIGCPTWSPNGARLACGAGSEAHPNRDGIYTVRSSDGGGLRRVTRGEDCVSDYSPNGKRLAFTRETRTGHALFTVRLDGSGLRRITPPGVDPNFCNGSGGAWSPQANEIVFSAHVPNSDHHSSVWVVHADGSGLHRIPVPGCGGPNSDPTAIGCFNPSWSPDGKKIVFGRQQGTGQRDLYTVNVDGSGLFQVTHTPQIEEFSGDWGTHPITP